MDDYSRTVRINSLLPPSNPTHPLALRLSRALLGKELFCPARRATFRPAGARAKHHHRTVKSDRAREQWDTLFRGGGGVRGVYRSASTVCGAHRYLSRPPLSLAQIDVSLYLALAGLHTRVTIAITYIPSANSAFA